MLDFKLDELEYLEETTGPTIRFRVQNGDIDVPANWHILAVDRETYTVDSIPIATVAAYDHDVLLFSPNDSKLVTTKLNVVELFNKASVIHPMVPKASALIHCTGPELSHGKSIFYGIVIGPYDLHRWIGNKAIGEILT